MKTNIYLDVNKLSIARSTNEKIVSYALVDILAKNPYFIPTPPKILKTLFLSCFFIPENFVVVIIVIIFTYVFVEY